MARTVCKRYATGGACGRTDLAQAATHAGCATCIRSAPSPAFVYTQLMRIDVINPNTTAAMTAAIGRAAEAVAAPGTRIVASQPAFGAPSIEGHHDDVWAAAGVTAQVRAGQADGADAFVIACFGDPGLAAARELATGPVIGIAEAAFHCASLLATGFSVVTTLERTCVIAEHLVVQYGFERRCRGIHGTEIAVLELDDPASDAYARILAASRDALALTLIHI